MAGKPTLSVEQQIEHLESKGVTFDQCSREDAADYLREKCNYFKLASYRKLFAKYVGGRNDGKYISLDFSQLRLLAELDQQLRALLLQMTLDIEHFQKVALLAQMEERGENGYLIVADYMASLTSSSKGYRLRELERSARSPYSKEIYEKYRGHMPAWVFFELTSFGTLIDFVRFCGIRWNDRSLKQRHYDLKSVKSLRNCAAHGSCIINQFASKGEPKNMLSQRLAKQLPGDNIPRATKRKWLNCRAILEIAATLILYNNMVPDGQSKTKSRRGLSKLYEQARNYPLVAPVKMPNDGVGAAFSFLERLTHAIRLLE